MRQHFSEYFRPTEAEKKSIWEGAIFVFDTNVLLNMYRMSRETCDAIMGILKSLKSRLFLPHQVGVEFFRHREEEIARQVNAFESVRRHLRKVSASFIETFPRHACIPIPKILDTLKDCTNKLIDEVDKSQDANQLNYFVHPDPILPELADVFGDLSEGPYTKAEDDSLNKKVDERVQQNLPPCWIGEGEKANKPKAVKGDGLNRLSDHPHRGDGRVWFQIVKHAGEKKKPIIFITGDQKPNWWRVQRLGSKDQIIGPHFQLIRDVESESGQRFLMYTQEGFLAEAPKYLGVPEQVKAIEEIKQIREIADAEKETDQEAESKEEDTGLQVEAMEKYTDSIAEDESSLLEKSEDKESDISETKGGL